MSSRSSTPNEMRAVVYDRYGPPEVQRLEDVAQPVPGNDEVLVKIFATTVNRLDCATRDANRRSGVAIALISRAVFGIRRPRRRILGSEFSGVVEAVGAKVGQFAVGDHVFGATGMRFGAHAEYICMRENARIGQMPIGTSFEQAAAVCDGAFNALACLRQAHLKKGQTILVYGASGSIGSAGVQLARYFGADITAVCGTRNLELVKSLGADGVLDYTRDDFTRNGETYDVIFDAVGKQSFRRCRGSLKPGGSYLATDGFKNLLLALRPWGVAGKRVRFPTTMPTRNDILLIKGLIEAGRYRPVIDRCYPLEQVVEATRYVETERKTGNVVLTVSRG
jgi:NADPH:quinone reductase-like Zn-dependent oxidoreductase